MKTSDWINLVIALGTLALAVVAIWGDRIKSWVAFGPQLSLEPLGIGAITKQSNGMKVRFFYLRVRNTRAGRFPPAHETQVLITRIEAEDAAGEPTIVFAETVPLTWVRQEVYPLLRTIGPDAEANLLRIREDGWFQFETIVRPHHLPQPGIGTARFWVTVQARSNEADSRPRRFRVTWDGQWQDGQCEIERHLVVALDPAVQS